MLDALGKLGLRLPSFDYDTADKEVKRGYDNLAAYYQAHKEERESATGRLTPRVTAEESVPDGLTTNSEELEDKFNAELGF